jgi:hypothetical protein
VKENSSLIERFLKFISNTGHEAQVLDDAVITSPETQNMDTVDCRGQAYDNAANMSSECNGLQTKIKRLCHKQTTSRLFPISLNLDGTSGADSHEEAC